MKLLSGSLNIGRTSTKEKRYIKEALKILQKSSSTDDAEFNFINSGWKRGSGAYKRAYMKNGIVVKSGPTSQLNGELKRWKRYRGKPYRKHIARVFGITKHACYEPRSWGGQRWVIAYMFQREVPRSNGCDDSKNICSKIACKLKIPDWWHNHGHLANGTPVWFDTIL